MNDLFWKKSSTFEDLIILDICKQTKLKYGLDLLKLKELNKIWRLNALCLWRCFLFGPIFPIYSLLLALFFQFPLLFLFSHFSSFGLVLPFFLFWSCFPIFLILAMFSLFFLFRCAMLHRVVCRHFLSVNGPRNRLLLQYKHQTASFLLYQKLGGIGDWGLIFAL